MAKASDTQGLLFQNLIDAGCNKEMIQECMSLVQSKETTKLKQLLLYHKSSLLDSVDARQKEIDCLDYLLFKLEKQKPKETITL